MKINDLAWQDIWSKEKYLPISDKYKSRGFGTDKEPGSSVCMASFANAMEGRFKEGMVLFDVGCGSGRFCNFMSKRLKKFSYYGVEKPGSNKKWGENAIDYANSHFGKDPRAHFGFIGDELEREAIKKADVVLLLSIFTHTTVEETNAIMDKLIPIMQRGGSVIFSIFIKVEYLIKDLSSYGFENFYSKIYHTKEQVENMAKRLNIKIDEKDVFTTSSGHSHNVNYSHIIFNAHK